MSVHTMQVSHDGVPWSSWPPLIMIVSYHGAPFLRLSWRGKHRNYVQSKQCGLLFPFTHQLPLNSASSTSCRSTATSFARMSSSLQTRAASCLCQQVGRQRLRLIDHQHAPPERQIHSYIGLPPAQPRKWADMFWLAGHTVAILTLLSTCLGTIVIHLFGAYFGLACAYVLGKPPGDARTAAMASVSFLIGLLQSCTTTSHVSYH